MAVLEICLDVGESPNNVFLRKVESKVLVHNFSQVCRNNTKVNSFAIGGVSNLFKTWEVKITNTSI